MQKIVFLLSTLNSLATRSDSPRRNAVETGLPRRSICLLGRLAALKLSSEGGSFLAKAGAKVDEPRTLNSRSSRGNEALINTDFRRVLAILSEFLIADFGFPVWK